MAKSKKYVDASRRYDKQALHEPAEAFELVKSMATKKFDETVEVAFRLGVDPRKADQMLRGTVSLPAGTGKDVRVAVFATGDAAARGARRRCRRRRGRRSREPGAERGLPGLRRRDRDARPDGPGRPARPRARAAWPHAEPEDGHRHHRRRQAPCREFKGGKVEYRTDRFGNVHVPLGKVSFPIESLLRNYGAVLDELQRAQPAVGEGSLPQGRRDVVDDGPGRQDLARVPRHGQRVAPEAVLSSRSRRGAVRCAVASDGPRHARAAERDRLAVAVAAHRASRAGRARSRARRARRRASRRTAALRRGS